jgi:hypothetical protein
MGGDGMSDDWLDSAGETTDVACLTQQVRDRLAAREGIRASYRAESLDSVVSSLRKEMIGAECAGDVNGPIGLRERDCDIVPRGYHIGWQVPVLGWMHAVVRKIVNGEVRRYLLPSLEKQSELNREVLRALSALARENERLREEIGSLRGSAQE